MMANKATPDRVAADMRPPNYRGALAHIRSTIVKKKDKVSSLNGEIAATYAQIEGMKVNKKAAKLFGSLDKMEASERNDVLRSLQGLVDVAEWEKDITDLVDGAQDNVVHLRFTGVSDDGGAGEEDDDIPEPGEEGDDGAAAAAATIADKAAAAPKPKATRSTTSVTEAARKKREALDAQAKGEPYTGDNSDLAG